MLALDRRRSVMSLAAALVLAGTVVLGGAPQAPSGAPASGDAWTAAAASGKVGARPQAQAGDSWLPVKRGDTVLPLSSLRTERRSRATMTRGGDIILVDSNTELVLPGPPAANGDLPKVNTIHQSSGKAIYRVQPGTGRRLEVVTPYLVAGVKGTVFSVLVSHDYVSVSVIEGIVQVRSLDGRRSTDLMAGDSAVTEGPEDRFETFRSGAGERGAPPAEPSLSARESFKETSLLVDSVSDGEPIRTDLDLDLWQAFSEDTLIERSILNEEMVKSLDADKQDDKLLIDATRIKLPLQP